MNSSNGYKCRWWDLCWRGTIERCLLQLCDNWVSNRETRKWWIRYESRIESCYCHGDKANALQTTQHVYIYMYSLKQWTFLHSLMTSMVYMVSRSDSCSRNWRSCSWSSYQLRKIQLLDVNRNGGMDVYIRPLKKALRGDWYSQFPIGARI